MPQKNTRGFYSTSEHYKRVRAAWLKKENPTVYDAILAMRAEGNDGWFEADPQLFQKYKGDGFRFGKSADPLHEISHLIMKAGHTPFQEWFSKSFERGFSDKHLHSNYQADLIEKQIRQSAQDFYTYYPQDYIEKNRHKLVFQVRDIAISYAAGLYMRQKLDSYLSQNLDSESYEKQRGFFERYKDNDSIVFDKSKVYAMNERKFEELCHKMPADFLEISSQEWRSIVAIATGMSTAEETPYPQRLGSVEHMLDEIGLINTFPSQSRDGEEHRQNLKQQRFIRKTFGGSAQPEEPLNGWNRSKHSERIAMNKLNPPLSR